MAWEPDKTVSTYDGAETELWRQAEKEIRSTYRAPDVREGAVLAQICADFLEKEGPLKE